MSNALELARAARIVREAVKDRSYRATPLGLEVARYIRWKRNEWGATDETIRDYEAILAKLALYFADLELTDLAPPVGTERLRECWDHYWGERTARTRAKVRSVWIDFLEWAVRERGLQGNAARPLAAPKKRDTQIDTFPPTLVDRVISTQTYPADTVGVTLILRYGLRRGGIANIQRKHFDFERRLLTVKTKGGRIYPLPLPEESLWLALGRLELEAQWQQDDWLLYHRDARRRRVPIDQAEEVLHDGKRAYGYATSVRYRHDVKNIRGRVVHDWWYRCLRQAGVIDASVTSGMNMHRGRHTAATELLRNSHDLKLTQLLLGHRDIKSTARYTQMDTSDLASALLNLYGDD